MKTVLKLTNDEAKRVIDFYSDYMVESSNDTILFQAKSMFVTVTIYHSLSCVFQGKDSTEEFIMWCHMLHREIPKDEPKTTLKKEDYFYVSIGSDEVGTGDFFGPITVCAAYLREDDIPFIKSLGIKDSKKLTDDKIMVIGKQLKDKVLFSLLVLHNDKFNDLFARGYNMNKMKAYLHNKAILTLLSKIDHEPIVVLDQFTTKDLYYNYLKDEHPVYRKLRFETKAEDKYASVAIGSIIARYAFLQHFELLSEKSGYSLVKGAGKKVDSLVEKILKEQGEDYLYSIAKINFKTLQKAKDNLS